VVQRLIREITAAGLLANALGAVVVTVFLQWLTFGTGLSDRHSRVSLALAAVYGLAATLVSFWRAGRMLPAATGWLAQDREPTPAERAAALALPARLAVQVFESWVGAAVLFGVLNVTVLASSGVRAVQVAATVALGGLTTCMAFFLAGERRLRPLFASALSGAPPTRPAAIGIRPRLVLSWALGSGVVLLGLVLVPLATEHHHRAHLVGSTVFLAVTGLVAGLALTVLAARSVADPIEEVRAGLRRVQAGDLDVQVTVDDGGEVGLLQAGFNDMVAGLRERLLYRDLLDRHVGGEVARHAVEHGVGLGGEVREVSALFVDVIGSTAMAQQRPATEVVALLNQLFALVVRAVTAEGGWINKFEGDAALCVFGAPADQPDHAARALRAARRLGRELAGWQATGGLDAAVGVSSGPAVAGNVGAEERYEYTVIGDPVNEAARVCEVAKARPGRVLASGAAVAAAAIGDGEPSRWAAAGAETLRGRAQPTALFGPTPAAG
jgi:adenylate cyclase